MNIKKLVKKHCPEKLLPLVILPYYVHKLLFRRKKKTLTDEQIRSIRTRAEKYLPYYQDDLSREILSARLEYLTTHDRNLFMNIIEKLGMRFHEFPYSLGEGISGVVIIYDNETPELSYIQRVLASLDWPGKRRLLTLNDFLNGAEEISDSELVVPILSPLNKIKLSVRLEKLGVKAKTFIGLYLICEDLQYFDVFSPVDDEIVVDAGAYDGATALQFLEWGKGKVKHVYSFEFDPKNAAKCEENLKPYADKVTLVKKGTWDKDEVAYVNISGGVGSSVNSKGSTAVNLTSIDSVVQDERVTFIKMDVEGAELKSLMGARNTIIKNHPRLAICAYHKDSDLYELPEYILSLVPEYKFLLRHYSSCGYETVLYAYCD